MYQIFFLNTCAFVLAALAIPLGLGGRRPAFSVEIRCRRDL